MPNNTNPYFKTPTTEFYKDILVMPEIEKSPDDREIEIPSEYQYRPDKMAKDLYGEERYWYAFMLRNRDLIEDPIYDFVAGLKIRIPSERAVKGIS